MALHLLAGISYVLDSTKRAHLLRRLLPEADSQNLIAVRPAGREARFRVVLIAHADAAYTGWLFHPKAIRSFTRGPQTGPLKYLRKSVWQTTVCLFLLAGLDLLAVLGVAGGTALFWPWAVLLSVPVLIGFVLNAQVVANDRVVPGANDNLSGCAGLVLLAERLGDLAADELELVYVVSGAEEAGTGGALRLAQERANPDAAGYWDPQTTVVVAVDSIANGELRQLVDGEVVEARIPHWLSRVAAEAAGAANAGPVAPYYVPSGASDAAPFHTRGYDALGLGCIDPDIGAPREYHWPTDDLEHLDVDQVLVSVDYLEAFVRRLAARALA